jgi:hypothetical protein
VRGTVNFTHRQTGALRNLTAADALQTGGGSDALGAIESLGENPRDRCFADAAWSRKKIGVPDLIAFNRIGQSAGNMLLARHPVKGGGSIFSRKNEV